MKALSIFTAALAAASILSGCKNSQQVDLSTDIVEDKGTVSAVDVPDAAMSWQYCVEYVTGGVPDNVKDAINGAIISRCIAGQDEETQTDVPAACVQWARDLKDGYVHDTTATEDMELDDNSFIYNWEFDLRCVFDAWNESRGWVSYCYADSQYLGGAHGITNMTYIVFDLKNGSIVTQDTFLKGNYQEDLLDLLTDAIYDYLGPEGEDQELFATPSFNDNFYVNDDGVTWIFNPYEIASFAAGTIEATLSWQDLKPYLK